LRLVSDQEDIESGLGYRWGENASGLCGRLAALLPGGPVSYFAWNLPFGGAVVLEAAKVAASLRAAA
jgi:hypothetical protein